MGNGRTLFKNTFPVAVVISLLFHAIVGATIIFNPSSDIAGGIKLQEFSSIWVSWISTESEADGALHVKGEKKHLENVQAMDKDAKKTTSHIKSINDASIPAPEEKACLHVLNNPAVGEGPSDDGKGKMENAAANQAYIDSQIHSEQSASGGSTQLPKYHSYSPPNYPWIARLKGYEGVVLISAKIDALGKVYLFKIKKSSGYAVLDRSAVDAVKSWTFEPEQKQGKPVTTWVDIPIKFKLNDTKTMP